MTDINPGDVVRVSTTPGFKNSAGTLTDPSTVVLRWRRHGEADTVWTWTAAVPGTNIVKDSTGLFHADITVVEPGLHHFRWEGTGTVVAAQESSFTATSEFIAGSP